jgi:predicted nuclease of restriction endonuclease-like RecB superfamily
VSTPEPRGDDDTTLVAREKMLAPRWLVPEDDAAIRRLHALYAAHEGCPRRELDEALARLDLSGAEGMPELHPRKRALVTSALDRHLRSSVEAPLSPRALRESLFVERARSAATRAEIVEQVRERVGLGREDLEAALFADLPAERLVAFDGDAPSLESLRAEANRILVEQLFARSREIEVRSFTGAREVVRTAQLRGLLVSARREERPPPAQLALTSLLPRAPDRPCTALTISGPFALFRHTRLYASATRALVPILARTRFEARVHVPGPASEWTFRLSSRDPFVAAFAGAAPRLDREIEDAVAKRFPRVAPEWELHREPEPLVLEGGRLTFPDLRFVDRRDPSRVVWLEIVGFWTPEHLRVALSALRAAAHERVILAVSERLATSESDIPDDPRILRFKGRIDPRLLRACLEALP